MNRPYIEKVPSILNKPDGSVLFECMVQANPEPEVVWYHKEQALAGDRYLSKVKKTVGKYACTLQIKGPTDADQGIYKVVAKNKHGESFVEQTYIRECTADQMYK